MRAFMFALRLSLSISRWRLIGVSNRKMRKLWDAFLSDPEYWWHRDELAEKTKMPMGSFEAELVELDMADLTETQKRFGGRYVRRLTTKGKHALASCQPSSYDWHHRRWHRAHPDPGGEV